MGHLCHVVSHGWTAEPSLFYVVTSRRVVTGLVDRMTARCREAPGCVNTKLAVQELSICLVVEMLDQRQLVTDGPQWRIAIRQTDLYPR